MSTIAEITVERRGAIVVVHIAGEVDVFNADEVGDALLEAIEADSHGLVVDLTALEFLDSTAIRRLFVVSGTLGARRMGMRVAVTAEGPVERTLGLVGFSQAAPVVHDVDAAVAELAGS